MRLANDPMMDGTELRNASVPMALVGTVMMMTIGMESAMQSRIGVTVLVAAGQGDDGHTDATGARNWPP
jgi:hypothetical protein